MHKICRFDLFWAKNMCDRELIDTAGCSLENESISLSLLEFGVKCHLEFFQVSSRILWLDTV